MWILMNDIRKDLKYLGIYAKIPFYHETTDGWKMCWKDETEIVFSNHEDLNYYKLAGKYNYFKLSIDNHVD